MRHCFSATKHITVLLLFCSSIAYAQWIQTSNGIYEGQVTSMTSINETIFVGTLGGVFRSTDNATTWSSLNTGLAGNSVNSLIAAGSSLYVALNGGGTYRSSNSGTNWEEITVPATLVRLAAVGNTVYGLTNNGALYSISSTSTTATAIVTGLTNVSSFTASGTTLFLGTISNGLYSSTDAGSTWMKVNSDPFFNSVFSLDSKGSTILVWADSKIFISTNGGTSWGNTSVSQMGNTVVGLLNNKILVGTQYSVQISSDNGVSWSSLTGLPAMTGFASNTQGYYAGTIRGIYRSADGVLWTAANTGMMSGNVRSVVSLNNKFFTTSSNNLYSSADWGTSWQLLNTGIPYGHTVLTLTVSGSNVLAGTYNNGVYLSSNGGTSWSLINSLIGATCFVQLGGDLYAGNYSGVYVSKDNGASWSFFSSIGFVNALGARGGDLFVAANKLTRFSNAGLANQAQKELPFSNPVSAFTSLDDSFFCGTTNAGVFISIDNGETWAPVNNGLVGSFIVTSMTVHENYLYVSRIGEGVYYSANDGASWSSYNSGLPTIITNQLNFFPSLTVAGGKLLAGTSSAGVWSICPFLIPPLITAKDLNTPNPVLTSSETEGNQWFYNGAPISNATGASITVTQSGAYYVEVPTLSGCKRKSADQAIVVTGNISPFSEAPMIDVFPNPSSNTVNIDLKNLPMGQRVAIDVFDTMGKKQKALMGYGGQQLLLEIDQFATGIYIIKSCNDNNLYLTRFIKQ